MASFLTRFFGRTASEGAAFAIGTAVGPALTPAVREIVNEAWARFPTHPLDAASLAEIVAEDVELLQWGRDQAVQNGIAPDKFDPLVKAVRNAPGVPELFALWRRNLIDEAEFTHGLRKAKLEPLWDEPLKAMRYVLLSPENLAMMRQQGFIEQARQYEESALQGVTNERAELLFKTSGLPPGIETGLEMLRREIINEDEFGQIVREGHTKTKYTDELLALRHPVLSASVATTLRIKGWIQAPAQHALGALSGYTAAQMDQMYLAAGRPAAPGQMWTAWARGIDGPDGVPMNEAQFLKGIQESDIRPEWAKMLWGIRFSYPPLFQINRLVLAGAIDVATAVEWAHKDRYAPEVVTALRAYWQDNATSTADPHIEKARTQLWTTQHTSYKSAETNDADAKTTFDLLAIPGTAQTQILRYWKRERAIVRKQLTPTQIKKAFAKAVNNPATGRPWTREDAFARLVEIGMSSDDANTFLDE